MEDKGMLVTNLQGKITTGCNGVYGYDAEATVEEGGGGVRYAHANLYDGELTFTVSDTSVYAYLTGEGKDDPHAVFTEEYEGIGEAQESGSKYVKVFEVLDRMIALMEGNC